MAKQTITLLVDDLDQSEASETVRFGVDGVEYTIDLNGEHAKELRTALEVYVAAGTRLGRVQLNAAPPKQPAKVDREQNRAIRAFAQEARKRGVLDLPALGDRGRISEVHTAAYHKYGGVVPPRPTGAEPAVFSEGYRKELDEGTAEPTPPPAPRKRAKKAPEKPFTPAPSSQGGKGAERELNRLYRAFWRDAPMRLGLPPYKGRGTIPQAVIEAYDNQ